MTSICDPFAAREAADIVNSLYPEMAIDTPPTVDEQIARDCQAVAKLLPLLKDKTLSIEDFMTIHSEKGSKQQVEKLK